MFFFKRRRNNILNSKIYRLNRGPRYVNPRRSNTKKFLASIFVYINILLVAAIGYFLYFFLFSGYFTIDNIELSGNDKISSFDIQKLVSAYLDEKRFYILPNNNLIILSKSALEKKINENFVFNDLKIDKVSPNTIKILINEKEPKIQFNSGEKTYLLDSSGLVIQRLFGKEAFSDIYKLNNEQLQVDYTKFSYSELPLIYNQTNDQINLGQFILNSEKISEVEQFVISSKQYPYIKINRVEVPDLTAQYLNVINEPNNWQFYLNFNDDIALQLKRMDLIIKETIKEEKLGRVNYIDLRMGENVYYKMK